LVFEKGKGKNKGIETGEEKTYGETKRFLNACCLTLSYLFKFGDFN
jgi:hypothetical protein